MVHGKKSKETEPIAMRPATDRELTDDEALAFHRHCVELELDQAVRQPLAKSMRALCREGTSPFVLAEAWKVSCLEHDRRLAAQLSHDTIITRSGLGLGFIDPMTGRIRE